MLPCMSPELMLWTAPPPGTCVPWMWVLAKGPHDSEEPNANGHYSKPNASRLSRPQRESIEFGKRVHYDGAMDENQKPGTAGRPFVAARGVV